MTRAQWRFMLAGLALFVITWCTAAAVIHVWIGT